jgi:hypothetical protein
MAVGGVLGLISEELAADNAARLPQLLDEVLAAALRPYVGDEAATGYVEGNTRG